MKLKIKKMILSLPFIIGGIYHVIGYIWPNLVEPSTAARHLAFVGINALMSIWAIFSPRTFFYPLLILSLQQFYSHGIYMYQAWVVDGRIDWYSVITIWAMFFLLIFAYALAFSKSVRPQK